MNTGARVRERNGQLELDIPQSSNAYVGYTSVSHYDAVDSHLSVQLKSAGNQALSSLEAVTSLRKDPSNRVSVVVGNHLLTVRKTVAAVQTNLYSTAYDPIAMAYLRIREAQGVTFFEVAPDGVTYSPLYLVADPFDLSVVTVTLSAGTFRDETSNSLVVFDNVNLP